MIQDLRNIGRLRNNYSEGIKIVYPNGLEKYTYFNQPVADIQIHPGAIRLSQPNHQNFDDINSEIYIPNYYTSENLDQDSFGFRPESVNFVEDLPGMPEYLRDYYFNENSVESCSICIENFKNGQKIIRLKCFHIFHEKCIILWAERQNICPECRNII
jgi:Ring finger domain